MTTLKEQIGKLQEEFMSQLPKETLDTLFKALDDMTAANLTKNAIGNNQVLPSGELINLDGKAQSIEDIIDTPTVISFYRGSWCPYCNLELKALQDILPQIKEKGAKLIAISPEKPDSSLSFKEKLELDFDVFTDTNNNYARDLGLVFKLEDHIDKLYKEFGFDLEKFNEVTSQELPFPATIIVDKTGKIVYSFISENYTLRTEPSEILSELDKIK
ncbi:MAG: AhpC/TSA family protein [Campylobacteraceae bacterium]|nr:AhpC/TSA family protein [Campylobacteraceae bacterium]